VSCGTKRLYFLEASTVRQQNVTLHGAHDLASWREAGSVSAATTAFAAHIEKSFSRTGTR
jgi:hypothetical protein